jgi:galactokinase
LTEPQHRAAFSVRYGHEPTLRAAAPGRVNLIGEHTDYNSGFVLPIVITQSTRVLIARRQDQTVRLWSANVAPAHAEVAYELGRERRTGNWSDYIAGVTSGLRDAGITLGGFDVSIVSTVPLGAGLSSSASLEVAVLRALNELFVLKIDALTVARLAHAAETAFVGVPVGMMDQMAVSLGVENAALFIDTQSLARESLRLPTDTALIVIDSGVPHEHAGGEYRIRRAECIEAANRLGVASLRDATMELLDSRRLPDPFRKRARHVISENQRVLGARQALRNGNAAALGLLMNASHLSLRDDFEVSVADVDRLVALAQSEHDVFGARMTGGGFGGAIVGLAGRSSALTTAQRIANAYTSHGRYRAAVLSPHT